MKSFISLILIFLLVIINACSDRHNDFISRIDPGRFDSTWWNYTPLRFVQTNLREIDVSIDQDLYVKSGGKLINHSGQIGAAFREPFIIQSTNIRFKPVRSVREIRLLRSGEKVRFRENDGWIKFSVPEIRDFEMALAIYR